MKEQPTNLTRSEAQKRADDIRVFKRELDRLQDEGALTLTDDQQQALSTHHKNLLQSFTSQFDVDRDQHASQLSLTMRAASFLGALALAAAVFFLFYQVWGALSTSIQVSLLIAFTLGTYVATHLVHRIDRSGYFTKLVALVAFACFVLNIAMLGQIFNMVPTDRALLPWAALAFVLAYLYDLRLLLATGIICVVAYIGMETGTWGGMYWLDSGMYPENYFPAAFVLFLVPRLVSHRAYFGFEPVYRVFGALTLLIPIMILSHWGYGSHLSLDPALIEGGYQVAGFVVSALLIAVGARRDWNDLVNTGIIFFVIFLYTKFYDWWWEILPKYLFFLVIGLTSILILLVLRRIRTAVAVRVTT